MIYHIGFIVVSLLIIVVPLLISVAYFTLAERKLLASIIKSAYRSARHEGVDPVCEAAASVRASQESERGIVGYDKNGERLGYDYPDIPAGIPESHEWHTYQAWRIPELSPPVGMVSNNDDAFPHIRMDAILNALVGDKC